jgi:hypothetical protein
VRHELDRRSSRLRAHHVVAEAGGVTAVLGAIRGIEFAVGVVGFDEDEHATKGDDDSEQLDCRGIENTVIAGSAATRIQKNASLDPFENECTPTPSP